MMRQIVIDRIRNSKLWQDCLDNGLEDELPNLEMLGDFTLLDLYNFYAITK